MNENTQNNECFINKESDIATARKIIRDTVTEMGFDITDTTRIVTAASELIRNILLYAGSGNMRWCTIKNERHSGIKIVFKDNGPGIPDIEQAMEKGFTTSGGLGLGLPGAKRMMDEMEISSMVGEGTEVKVIKWLRNN